MKKLLLGLVFLAVLTGSIFAQAAPAPAPALKVEGLFDAYWVPFQYVSREFPKATNEDPNATDSQSIMGMGMGRDSGTQNSPRFRLLMSTSGSNYIGFTFTIQFMLTRQGTAGVGAGGSVVNDPSTTGVTNPNVSAVFSGFDGNSHMWWKPFGDDLLNIRVGFYEFDDLRGKIGDPPWIRQFEVGGGNGDTIFQRFHNNNSAGYDYGAGVLFVSKPIPDLLIGVNFKGLIPFQGNMIGAGGQGRDTFEAANFNTGANELIRVLERTQVGIGYTIKDVGLVRAQWVGANKVFAVPSNITSVPSITAPRIEFAFQVLALDKTMGLMFDIGGKVPLAAKADNTGFWQRTDSDGYKFDWVTYDTDSDDFTAQPDYQASLGIRFQTTVGEGPTNNLNIQARVDAQFGGSVEFKKIGGVEFTDDNKLEFPLQINAHIWPSYNLGFATIGLHIGFNYSAETKMGGEVVNKGEGHATTTTLSANSGARNGEGLNGGMRIGFSAWLAKTIIPNNTIQIGLAFRPKSEFNGTFEDMAFTIPVSFASRF